MAPIANGCRDTNNNNNNSSNHSNSMVLSNNKRLCRIDEEKLSTSRSSSIRANDDDEPVIRFSFRQRGAINKLSRLYNTRDASATPTNFNEIDSDYLISETTNSQTNAQEQARADVAIPLETFEVAADHHHELIHKSGFTHDTCFKNSSSRQLRAKKSKEKTHGKDGILMDEQVSSSFGGLKTIGAPSDRVEIRHQQRRSSARKQKITASQATENSLIEITTPRSGDFNKLLHCDTKDTNKSKVLAKNRQVAPRRVKANKKVKYDATAISMSDACNCNKIGNHSDIRGNSSANCDKTLAKVMANEHDDNNNEEVDVVKTSTDIGPPSPSQDPGSKNKSLKRQHKLISLGENKLNQGQRSLCNKHMPWFGIDIGGTLVKVVFFDPKDATPEEEVTLKRIRRYLRSAKPYGTTGKRDSHLEMPNVIINKRAGSLHFIRFATSQMPDFLNMAKSKSFAATVNTVCATGGGAYKFEDIIRNDLGITLHKTDELDSIIIGIHYIDKFNSDRECYFLDNPLDDAKCAKVPYNFSQPYPYLVVNIGSGVSILAVYSSNSYSRVSGSSIGGGTFLGLCSLLTQCKTYEEAIRLAKTGSSCKIDKLVKDIYGGDYPKFNLSGDTVASSFGHMNQADKRKEVKRNDLARALLEMITINIGSIARMCAASEEIDRVVFIGNFLRVNQLSMRLLSYAVNYWSKGAMKALFLEHEGYFGAVGCFVESTQGCLGSE